MKKRIIFSIVCCMMLTMSFACEDVPQRGTREYAREESQSIKQSKVMRIGRYLTFDAASGHNISGTVIIFENGDYISYIDHNPRNRSGVLTARFACSLKEGDVVLYKKDRNGIELLEVVSFAEAK